MLPQSTVHRQLISQHTRLRPQSLRSAAPISVRAPVRCQSSRDSRQHAQRQTRDFGNSQQQDAQDFWSKGSVQEKAQAATQEASKRLKATYQSVSAGARKTASQVNQRFDIGKKAQDTADRVKTQLLEVDEKLQLRRKARNSADDVRRQLPKWRRQYGAFSRTVPGRVLTFVFVIWLVQSGLFFRLLNLFSILFFLAPLILLPLARRFSRQATAQAQYQQAQQQARQSQNPFQSGSNPFGGFRQQPSPNRSAGRQQYTQQDGPIIDAEWTTIDEDD